MSDYRKKYLKLAVFDVDKTLLSGTSAEFQFIRFLLEKNIISFNDLIHSIINILPFIFQGLDEIIYRKSSYLKGLDKDLIYSILPEFFRNYISNRINNDLVEEMEKLRNDKYEIVLISGTLDFLLDLFIDKFPVNGGIGSHLEIRDGKFTGQITDIHPYKKGKIHALYSYLNGRTADFKNSYAFADCFADVPLLSLFGNPVAVNPSLLLRLKAKREGWIVRN